MLIYSRDYHIVKQLYSIKIYVYIIADSLEKTLTLGRIEDGRRRSS